jgi:uncharacterized protein YegP (UPF0339 family)
MPKKQTTPQAVNIEWLMTQKNQIKKIKGGTLNVFITKKTANKCKIYTKNEGYTSTSSHRGVHSSRTNAPQAQTANKLGQTLNNSCTFFAL